MQHVLQQGQRPETRRAGVAARILSHLLVSCLRHATTYRGLQDASLILHGRSLEDMIASIGYGLLLGLVRVWYMHLSMVARLGYNPIRLIAVLCSQFAMPLQHLFRGMNRLAVPRAMGRNLCRARAFSSNLLQVTLDLFSSWTGCIQIFLRVALDLGLTVFAAFDLVAQPVKARGKLGTIHTGRILLRLEKTSLLKRPRLAVLTLGHIENDGMSMKLGRSIPIYRAGSIMLEGGNDKLGRRLWRVDIADSRLRIPLQFAKCHADTLTVRLPYPAVAAYKRSQRDGFRRGECRVPPGAMSDAGDFLAVFVLVGPCRLVLDELRAAIRMLSFAQPCEFFSSDRTPQSPLLGKPTLPLAMHLLVTAPVVLLLRHELSRMVCPRLLCR